jgi:hypothetical protein
VAEVWGSVPASVIEARQVIKKFPYRGDAVHALRGVDLALESAVSTWRWWGRRGAARARC